MINRGDGEVYPQILLAACMLGLGQVGNSETLLTGLAEINLFYHYIGADMPDKL